MVNNLDAISKKLKPISRVSVVENVTERVLTLISSGEVKPGERLPSEHELSNLLGVGRSSIREALRSLSILGIIEARPGRGTIVAASQPRPPGGDLQRFVMQWGLSDIFEVRVLLESHAALRAAERATNEDIEAIEVAAAALEKKAKAGKSYFSENLNFHLRVADASRNPVLVHSLASIIGSLRDVRETATASQHVLDDIEDHRRILAAIKAKKANAAEGLMRDHLERNVKEIITATGRRRRK